MDHWAIKPSSLLKGGDQDGKKLRTKETISLAQREVVRFWLGLGNEAKTKKHTKQPNKYKIHREEVCTKKNLV